VTDTWKAVPLVGAPTGRYVHTAVWTGSQMVVWGGSYYSGGYVYLNSGGVYDPMADAWLTTSSFGVPAARDTHTAVWTGSEMLVYGGNPISVGSGLSSYAPPRTVYLYQKP